jgi:hypothetical protein
LEGLELATLCIDLEYKLADSPRNLTRDQINFLIASLKARAESTELSELAEQGITRIVFRGDE